MEKANETNYERGIVYALELKGDIHCYKFEYDKAIESYEQGLAIARAIGIEYEKALFHGEIGTTYILKREFDKAEMECLKSLGILEKLECKAEMATLYGIVGYLHFQTRNIPKAEEYVNKAEYTAKGVGYSGALLTHYFVLAEFYYEKGEYDRVIEMWNSYLGNLEKGREYDTAIVLWNIGLILYEKEEYEEANKKYDEALQYCNASLRRYQETNNTIMIIRSKELMGNVYCSKLYRLEAYECYNQSVNALLKVQEKRDLEDFEKQILGELGLGFGDICLGEGDGAALKSNWDDAFWWYDLAADYYNLSSELFEEIDEDISAAWAKSRLGHVQYRQEYYDESIDYYKQALDKFKSLNIHHGIMLTSRWIGDAYVEMGDYDEAIKYYEYALEETKYHENGEEKIFNKKAAAEINELMGGAYIKWSKKYSFFSDERRKHEKIGVNYLEKASELYKEIGKEKKAEDVRNKIPRGLIRIEPVLLVEIIVGIVTVIGIIIGIYSRQRKQRFAANMIDKIDETYTKFKMNSVICDRELLKLKNNVLHAYKKDILDEDSFSMLEKRIKEHLSDVKKRIIAERFFRSSLPPRIDGMLTQILAEGKISEDDFLAFKKMVDELTEIDERVKKELIALIEEWKGKQK